MRDEMRSISAYELFMDIFLRRYAKEKSFH